MVLAFLVLTSLLAPGTAQSAPSYAATPYVTAADSSFLAGIEGTAVDASGKFYAARYTKDFDGSTLSSSLANSAFGEVKPEGTGEASNLFFRNLTADTGTWNGARFVKMSDGVTRVLVADIVLARIIVATPSAPPVAEGNAGASYKVFCNGTLTTAMKRPNDIAAAKNGRIFTSGATYQANVKIGDGELWTCSGAGKSKRLGRFYRTNGIDLSPDDKNLYFSEGLAVNWIYNYMKVWRYDVDVSTGAVANKVLFVDFATLDGSQATTIDGMRCDSLGNLFVTRRGDGNVAVFNPAGQLIYRITTSFSYPTNLEFGGSDGKTLYIVGPCTVPNVGPGCVDTWQAPNPGRAFTVLNS